MITMDRYTIKQDEKNGILVLNDKGECVSPKTIVEQVAPRRVFAFEGKMGVGKTTFIKKLCEDLGTRDVVNSPTFAIVNVYEVEGGQEEIYHFDCYRLKDVHEAEDFGAEDYLYSGNICLIEWPDIISPLLPEDTVRVRIRVLENGDRELTVE